MSVGKKKDGRWYCAWRNPAQGNRIVYEYYGRGEDARTEAVERDLQLKMDKNRRDLRPADANSSTFRDLCQDYINARQVDLAPKTRSETLYIVARYALPVIGATPIRRLTMAHWSEIEKRMIARKVKPQTINKYFLSISGILAWAVARDRLQNHPWARRKPLRARVPEIALFTLEEFRSLLEAAEEPLAWAMEVAYHTGVRTGPSELYRLRWDDFDFETGALHVFSPKTGHSHTQYVSPAFLDRLQEKRDQAGDCEWVISRAGQPIRRELWRELQRAKEKAGIPAKRRIRLYDIRHFHITYALAGGADLLNLAHRVGHKNADMIVRVYAHLADEIKKKEAFRLPELSPEKTKKGIGQTNLLAKNVSQRQKKAAKKAANNVIPFRNLG